MSKHCDVQLHQLSFLQSFSPALSPSGLAVKSHRHHSWAVHMAVLSTQRSQVLKEGVAQFSTVYAAHRPTVQHTLNIAFVVYVLGSTYISLSSGSRKSSDESASRKGKGRAKQGQPGKPAKVAVSLPATGPHTASLDELLRTYRSTPYFTADWETSFGS